MSSASVIEARYLLILLEHMVNDDVCAFLDEASLNPAHINPSLQPFRQLGGSSFVHNYFCVTECADSVDIALVLVDSEPLRKLAEEKGLAEYIYFGDNGDPVTICSAAHVVKCINTSFKRVRWTSLDAPPRAANIFATLA